MKTLKHSLVVAAMLSAPVAFAEGDLSRADPAEVVIEMGSNDDGMYFAPSHLELETGKAYKIVLRNVDEIKHEVEANEFVDRIFTRKVEIVAHDGGLIAEIKGGIREVEIGPMQEVEWFIVPVQTGADIEFVCALPGHAEAGMVGTITIR